MSNDYVAKDGTNTNVTIRADQGGDLTLSPRSRVSSPPADLGGTAITDSTLASGGSGRLGWLSNIHKKLADIYTELTTNGMRVVPDATAKLGIQGAKQVLSTRNQAIAASTTITAVTIDLNSSDPAGAFSNILFRSSAQTATVTSSAWVEYSSDNSNWIQVENATAIAALGSHNNEWKLLSRYIRIRFRNTHASTSGTFDFAASLVTEI